MINCGCSETLALRLVNLGAVTRPQKANFTEIILTAQLFSLKGMFLLGALFYDYKKKVGEESQT